MPLINIPIHTGFDTYFSPSHIQLASQSPNLRADPRSAFRNPTIIVESGIVEDGKSGIQTTSLSVRQSVRQNLL